MSVFFAILAAFAGIWLFSWRAEELVGAVFGLFCFWFWHRTAGLKKRLAQLEAQLQGRSAPAEREPAEPAPTAPAATVSGETGYADAEPDFLIEPEPQWTAAQTAHARVSAGPAPDSAPEAPAPVPDEEGRHQVELWNIFVSYFTGGNVVVRAGVVVLFFGVAFLFKYSAEHNLVPIEYRLLVVALFALALLGFGWWQRERRSAYALILQGGGVGILYLTIFAALRLYQLLPAGLALVLLVGLALFSAALAILQDARGLAVIGVLGGFLAPVLTSTGGGSHVMLFSYYALLNLGILLTARYRTWRELNLLGFVFTFGIGAFWGAKYYHPELFGTVEPFLLIFFLFYLTIGILFARSLPLKQKGYIDGTMVFGTPIVCFALQVKLVEPYEYGLAWSALGLGLIYASVAWGIFRRGSAAMRTLIESFLAMGVIFGTVAIPLALDGRWTSTAWALEGAAIVWIAIKQQRWMPRIFGLVLQLFAGGAFLMDLHQPAATWPVLNSLYLGGLMIALAALFSGHRLERARDLIASAAGESLLMLGWGLCWWFGSAAGEIERNFSFHYELAPLLAFVALSCLLAFAVGRKLAWPALTQVYFGLLPFMLVAAAYVLFAYNQPPSCYAGFAAWPLAFAGHYLLLHRDADGPLARWHNPLHIGLLLLLIGLATWEATWRVDLWVRGAGVWELVVPGLVPALFVYLICRFHATLRWPLLAHLKTYLYHALLPVALYLWLGSIATNLLSRGNPWPLPYLPLLNPLDLTQACVLLSLAWWLLTLRRALAVSPFGLTRRQWIIGGGATIFLWLNAILIRTLHYWGEVPFHFGAMLHSDLVQTALSIFWTLSALLVMLYGARRAQRPVWMVGAGLVALVIVKLFLFDLANTSTVERIVSFIGVGLICLVIGYLAPLPARAAERTDPL